MKEMERWNCVGDEEHILVPVRARRRFSYDNCCVRCQPMVTDWKKVANITPNCINLKED